MESQMLPEKGCRDQISMGSSAHSMALWRGTMHTSINTCPLSYRLPCCSFCSKHISRRISRKLFSLHNYPPPPHPPTHIFPALKWQLL